MANVSRMTKAQLIEHGKTLKIKLDNKMTKKEMLALVKQQQKATTATATKKKSKPKAQGKPKTAKPNKIVGKPVDIPQTPPKKSFVAETKNEEKSIWQTIKDFFGV